MDLKALRTLKFLEEMEKVPPPSQRELAKTLNISLGLVNLFMKQLIKEKFVLISSSSKKRTKYTLTQKGISEKRRLTYEFVRHSFDFYRISREKFRHLFQILVQKDVQRIALYGVGELAEIAYISLLETPIQVVTVVDDAKSGDFFMGLPIIKLNELSAIPFDRILIADEDSAEKAIARITAHRISDKKVITL